MSARSAIRFMARVPNGATGARAMSSNMITQKGGAHGNRPAAHMQWRNKPLLRREGDVMFRTGAEAVAILKDESGRRDHNEVQFNATFGSCLDALAPVFDRNPKLAWIAKQLAEPERTITFRVAWLDDQGTLRLNRGFRCQYSSSLGPYDGGLHFGKHVTTDYVKASAFDALCMNSLSGGAAGGAAGGSDFNPENKSEAEIQRFCQCFMNELSKYLGPDIDHPGMGLGVGAREIGYMYGQWKRTHQVGAQRGRGLLWGGAAPFPHATGFGVAHFAEALLQDKKDSLKGKRVLITGSGDVALAVAEKVIAFGGHPITLSDSSGHIFEEDGIDASKLSVIKKIKADRGARIGRYIVASTTAKFLQPENIYSIPCDVCIPCSGEVHAIGKTEATLLADHGCKMVVEGGNLPSTQEAVASFKKRGLLYGPYKASLSIGTVANGPNLSHRPLASTAELDAALAERSLAVLTQVKRTAKEFNAIGDLNRGTEIASFLKVAEVMMAHGAV